MMTKKTERTQYKTDLLNNTGKYRIRKEKTI